jgi:hypothetical protein
VDKEICHLVQNSLMEAEKYGLLKLFVRLIPNNLADPNAISVYPEKSA